MMYDVWCMVDVGGWMDGYGCMDVDGYGQTDVDGWIDMYGCGCGWMDRCWMKLVDVNFIGRCKCHWQMQLSLVDVGRWMDVERWMDKERWMDVDGWMDIG